MSTTNTCNFIDSNSPCERVATHGYKNKNKERCESHKEPDMLNLRWKHCEVDECTKHVLYNYEGHDAKFCKDHKKENMIDVKHPKCTECKKTARYGYKSLERCAEHKIKGMKYLLSDICIFIDEDGNRCTKGRVYGYNGKKVQYCNDHKEPDMVDLRHDLCQFMDEDGSKCCKRAFYATNKRTKAKFCGIHKQDGMILKNMNYCIHVENSVKCTNTASFGIKGGKPQYCRMHKTSKDTYSKVKKCEHEIDEIRCVENAYYNYKGEKGGKYCITHKKLNMVNITHKLCIRDECVDTGEKKYNDYCVGCFTNMYPDDDKTVKLSNSKSYKEISMKLNFRKEDETFFHEAPIYINVDNQMRRIDLYKIFDNIAIMILFNNKKVDHIEKYKNYKSIIIVMNLYDYKNDAGNIKRTQQNTRLNTLAHTIESITKDIDIYTKKDVYIEYLYQDGY